MTHRKQKMKKRTKISTVCFLLFAFGLCAQINTRSFIKDNESNKAIPYVNIGVVNSSNGTVSDHTGRFEIESKTLADSIIMSSIGYVTQTICLRDIRENTAIRLFPETYILEELEISSKSYDQEVILGERNLGERGHSFGFGSAQLGTELGAVIEVGKKTIIESVNFVLNHAKGDSLMFRVNVYEYKNGTVGNKLLNKNIYFSAKQRPGLFTIDVSEYDIQLDQNVVLTLEWLRNFDQLGNRSITFDTKKSKTLRGTYIKYSNHMEFQKLPYKTSYKPCIYFIGRQIAE